MAMLAVESHKRGEMACRKPESTEYQSRQSFLL